MSIEKHSDHAVMTFARANPPTTGHAKLFKHIQDHARKEGADHHIFLSHSQDAKKNPLSHKQKREFIHKMVPHLNVHEEEGVKTPIDALKHLHKKGYKHVTVVVGGDRHQEMSNLVHKYNGKDYHFHKLEVKSAGERDPDAEGVEGMSASKMREHATKKNFKEFSKGVIKKEHAKELYRAVRKGMKLENYQAVFLVGGPGSGKDFVLREALYGAMEISLDKLVEAIHSNENIPEIDGRPLILNGQADDEDIATAKAVMEAMSYQTTMVFVYTDNITSCKRTKINEAKRAARYDASINAMHQFKDLFSEGFFLFDNSQDLRLVNEETKDTIASWLIELPTLIENYYKNMTRMGFNVARPTPAVAAPKTPHPVPKGMKRIKDGSFNKLVDVDDHRYKNHPAVEETGKDLFGERKLVAELNNAFDQIDEVESRSVIDMMAKKEDTKQTKQGDKYKHNGIAVAGAKDNERVVQESELDEMHRPGNLVQITHGALKGKVGSVGEVHRKLGGGKEYVIDYSQHHQHIKDEDGRLQSVRLPAHHFKKHGPATMGEDLDTINPNKVRGTQEVSVPQTQAAGVKYSKKNPAKGAVPPAGPYNSNIGQVPSGGVGLSTSIGEAVSFKQFRQKQKGK
jgi:hypothetical protein